jgi:small multidrug resistance pump
MHAILFLTVIVSLTTVADYLLKIASGREGGFVSLHFFGGAIIYALSAVGWVHAMRRLPLASIGVYYAMLSLLLLAALGVVVFGERLTGREVLGLVLACVSIGLMARLN